MEESFYENKAGKDGNHSRKCLTEVPLNFYEQFPKHQSNFFFLKFNAKFPRIQIILRDFPTWMSASQFKFSTSRLSISVYRFPIFVSRDLLSNFLFPMLCASKNSMPFLHFHLPFPGIQPFGQRIFQNLGFHKTSTRGRS